MGAKRWALVVGGLVLGAAVVLTVVVTKPWSAHSDHVCCQLPPDTSAIEDVPERWQAAVADGDVATAWGMLTPEAQRRYGTRHALAAALDDLKPSPRAAASWQLIASSTQGRGTPGRFLYLLVEDDSLRPVRAVVVHSRADGTPDGRIDPDVPATVRIQEPADRAVVGLRPRMRSATGIPPAYTAVQAGRIVRGAVGAIREADGHDAPFTPAGPSLRPGPALIVAVQDDDRYTYGTVRVTVRRDA
ncbi:hypothetical protein [Actinomadura sp. NBRC 104425]|uniref:hypothetical protein n=1 Tax=Actinomadura sp. NBRC 104425 TaxID=3032204 RepID=UPI0025578822|nr:hypothetical protein [Actinomadura sp. NBRC 104425]